MELRQSEKGITIRLIIVAAKLSNKMSMFPLKSRICLSNHRFWCVVIDMTFDDDTKLFGLIRRYSDPEEAEELKNQVVNYVRTQIHDVNTEI